MSDEAAPEKELGPSVPAGAISRELLIINKRGLHARASAKFVQMVEKFNAEVWVTRGSETVGGTSIMGLMMLAAGPGTTVTVSAKGPEAQQAVDATRQVRPQRAREDRRHVIRVLVDERAADDREAAAGVADEAGQVGEPHAVARRRAVEVCVSAPRNVEAHLFSSILRES